MSQQARETAGQALLDFQSVMEQFLVIQRDVLGAYLTAARSGEEYPFAPQGLGPESHESAAPLDLMPIPGAPAARALEARAPAAPPASITADQPATDFPALIDLPNPSALVRLSLRATPRPTPGPRAALAPGHVVVVTDDGRGVATAVAQRLEREGVRVALVRTASSGGATAEAAGAYTCALDTLEGTERLVASIVAAMGPVAALIHLLPLSPAPPFERMPVADSSARLGCETRGLFLLAKALRPSLQRAASKGGAAVLAVTAMGGRFGTERDAEAAELFPGQGGVVGLTKCLAIEWPSVRVRAVDVSAAAALDVVAGHIVDELLTGGAEVEIGYAAGRRVGLELAETPAMLDAAFTVPSDAVVLATGGARGITAEVCLELAQRYQPTLVLVGQTPLPSATEAADTAELEGAAELKRVLMARLAQDGARVTVVMVERAYQQLLREREMRRNLGALSAAGARIHYVALDIRDDAAFAALIEEIYRTYGRLDGVIHGAGIIEDKLVQDKSLDSFERVLETKTRSAFVLARSLRPESLRFAVFFSSVAGRFGNRGQADYAAANEVVNKLAVLLDARWPTRVCSINWAPWDRSGMVSAALKREFLERGVALIDPVAGRRAFWEEIQQPRVAPAEIVVAGPGQMALSRPAAAAPVTDTVVATTLPLMKHATRQHVGPGEVHYARLLDPSIDHYLKDHRLDGRPVLPLAVAAELMAEAAQATWPDLTVLALRNLQLLKGIVIDGAPVAMTVIVRAPVSMVDPMVTLADVEITTPSLTPPKRYRAVVELGARPADPPPFTAGTDALVTFPLSLAEAYRRWTFHGPAFQRLTSIDGIGPDSMRGGVRSLSAESGVEGVARADWHIDPFVFDCALQMLLMWSRSHNDRTALPARFEAFSRFGSLSDTPLQCHVRVESLAGGHALRSDVHFVGPDGRVLGILQGMEASCTAALNRLAVN